MQLSEALETYTRKRPKEILLVRIHIDDSDEEVLVFRGASSYLTRATPTDPGQPVIPDSAKLLGVDRQQAPYDPVTPTLLDTNLQMASLTKLLAEVGIEL
ncbi:MAG: hypothetical protein H7Y37_08490 [Anaerolineae bacterium]|nr:hypothetical protein [Gloeobacterales cyanobacterium ES-bin-313]